MGRWILTVEFAVVALSAMFANSAVFGQDVAPRPSAPLTPLTGMEGVFDSRPQESGEPFTISRTLSLDSLGEGGGGAENDQFAHLGSFGNNLRFSWDFSSRPLYSDLSGQFFHATFLGMDMHKVLTGSHGDWGTLLLQPYLTRLDNFPRHPPFFDDGDDWELVWRIFNFNYTGVWQGKTNFRVGHFEIPFGLEQVINTNGTLLDYTHGRNLGVKADWGVTLNGVLPSCEYEFALSRGSGNDWRSEGDPYIVAGRIGTPREDAVSCGVSAFYGEVYRYATPENPLQRWRGAFDTIFGAGPFDFLGEVSFGEDAGVDIINGIAEVGWSSPKVPLRIYSQLLTFNRQRGTGWDHNAINNLGFRWVPDSHWAISAQWRQDLSTFQGMPEMGVFAFQVRYRT